MRQCDQDQARTTKSSFRRIFLLNSFGLSSAQAFLFFHPLLIVCNCCRGLTSAFICREERVIDGVYGIGMKVDAHPPHLVQALNGLEVFSLPFFPLV